MGFMFSKNEIDFFRKIKTALDPKGLCNPGKIIPVSSSLKAEDKNIPTGVEIDTENGVVSAPADIKVSDLAKQLKEQNLYIAAPHFKGTPGELFDGGLCSEFNHSVTGVIAKSAEAQILRYGGKFVKNSAGYNLIRLFCGASGAYAKTERLTLKLFREPQKVILREAKKEKPDALQIILKKALDPQNILAPEVFKEFL